jgi:cardiolipin synthase
MTRRLRQLPNLVSAVRILLTVPIAVALVRHQLGTTLWLFGVAGASDGLDGFLAKRFGWRTELGGILDPVADKLMMATVFVILALAISYRVLIGPVKAQPSTVSKLNTLCQVTFVLVVIAEQRFSWLQAWALWLGASVFVTVVVSGIDYVLVYGRQAAEQARLRHRMARGGGSNPA